MRATVFIATSLDGFIARRDGDLQWLTGRADATSDMGYHDFMTTIDTVAMGRGTYEKVLSFGSEQWPYAGKQVAVLSTTLAADADDRITVYRDLPAMMAALADRRIYADGGQLIQSMLRLSLLDELTITTAPVLLGDGLPLFGPLESDIALEHRQTRVLDGGFVQSRYAVLR